DQAQGHILADEDDAPVAAVAHVEAQVQLGEVAVARPGHAEYPGVKEIERHQTDEALAVARVQVQPGRQPLLQQRRRDGVRGQEQVGPAGAQKGEAHTRCPYQTGGAFGVPARDITRYGSGGRGSFQWSGRPGWTSPAGGSAPSGAPRPPRRISAAPRAAPKAA